MSASVQITAFLTKWKELFSVILWTPSLIDFGGKRLVIKPVFKKGPPGVSSSWSTFNRFGD